TMVLFQTVQTFDRDTEDVLSEKIVLLPCIFPDYASYNERLLLNTAIESSVEGFVSRAEALGSAYAAAKKVHDDIAAAVNYGWDENEKPLDTAYAHSIVGVMDGDSSTDAVCEGYAKSFQLVLNALDIDNIYVVGLGNGGSHAWNMARLDNGEYYWFDLTWDDQSWGLIYDYFAKGTMNFDLHAAFAPINTGTYFLYELPDVPNKDFDPSSIVRSTSTPTAKPTEVPTATPTVKPTATAKPTEAPSVKPTEDPAPTAVPTVTPTSVPKPIKVTMEKKLYGTSKYGVIIMPDNYKQDSRMFIVLYDEDGILKSLVDIEDYKDGIYLPLEIKDRMELKVFIFENDTMVPLSDMNQLWLETI
ncbi:MAG: transglutaminase domain-containing protein, partial [Candidatus Ornithomonoglobus sp.]